MKLTALVSVVFAALALGEPSVADQWYVDAAHGSDANPGTSPTQAWRTITHALATAPGAPAGGTQVLHVAPGLYDAALGETFPILLRDAFQIVGDGGAEVTIVDGGGAESVLRASHNHFLGNYLGPLTLASELTLRNAGRGVDLDNSSGVMTFSLQDSRITAMTGAGFRSSSGCGFGCGTVSATLTRVAITGCGVGVECLNGGPTGLVASIRLVDCDVSDNLSTGIHILAQITGSVATTLTRVRTVGNGGDGVLIDHQIQLSSTPLSVRLLDSLVARNGGHGVSAQVPANIFTPLTLGVVGCTIADNAASGLDIFFAVSPAVAHRTTLAGTILFGNLDDVRENPVNPSIVSVTYGDVGDGDFAGSNGNFSADPMFRDAASSDYRLAWGSPCIDTGDPAAVAGAPDLAGVVRPVDGDLDIVERNDVGAHEFAPLGVARRAHIGSNLVFELWGPAGGQANLLFSRRPLAPTPLSTPFGDFDLDPTHTSDLGASPIAPGPPLYRSLRIPNDPAYIGRSFSFQALATSTLVNPPAAYTNPVRVTILP